MEAPEGLSPSEGASPAIPGPGPEPGSGPAKSLPEPSTGEGTRRMGWILILVGVLLFLAALLLVIFL